MSSPVLSVIVPTYNRACYLPCAVESALAQSSVDLEVIIIDDGSTDGTDSVVEKHRRDWGQRVRYVWQNNSERSVARNHGLRLARGEYVAFLDSDDIWRPEHANTCIRALQNDPSAVAAYGEYGVINAEGYIVRAQVKRPATEGLQFQRTLCLKRLILHPTEVIIRRSAVPAKETFDPDIPGAEDWVLWVTLAEEGRFLRLGKPTVWMRLHPGGTFGDPGKLCRSLRKAAEKVMATGLPRKCGISANRVRAINLVHCAYAYYLSQNWPQAVKYMVEAIRTYTPILIHEDFLKVGGRLCLGRRLSSRIRKARHRSSSSSVPVEMA